MVTNVLSVDVEEASHAAIFRCGVQTTVLATLPSRVERNVNRLLDLLADHGATATFFTLGEIARLHPRMVKAIAEAGHEVASHGLRHEDVYRQTPEQFRADIREARTRLEDAIGQPVVGYRAANFSIGPAQSWAYEILFEEGFRYDSSVYPIHHDRYGWPRAPRFPHPVWRSGQEALVEFPVGTARLLGVNWPIGGGGYFRLLPFEAIRLGIERVNVGELKPVMFYLHPWELDRDQPRPPMSWRHRFRHFVGVDGSEVKLDRLLEWFRFGTAREALAALSRAPVAEAPRARALALSEPSFTP